MRVIPPLEITPARLTSTSAVELYAAYNAATTYSVGDRVLSVDGTEIYESLISINKGYPLDNSPLWYKLGSIDMEPQVDNTVDNVEIGQKFSVVNLIDGNVQYDGVIPSLNNAFERYILVRVADQVVMGVPQRRSTFLGVSYQLFNLVWTYAENDIVADGTKSLWRSATSSNVGHALEVGKVWESLGASNKRAMFGYNSNKRTTATSPLTVSLTPGKRIDAIDLSGMVNVKTVRVQMSVGGSPVYDQTINTQKRNVMSWYSHFFAPFTYKKSAVKFDIPPYSNGVITVTFTSAAGDVEVGSLIIGSQFYIGHTQYNATRDYVNYSTVTREFDGSIAKLVQRPGIPKTNQSVWLVKENAQALSEFLQSVDATPIAISGMDDTTDGYFEPIHIVGFIKSAPIDLAHPTHAICNMEIEAISSN